MIRAFLAIELSQALRGELAKLQQELRRRIEPEVKRDVRISWVQPGSIHLTLKFLGDTDEQLVAPMHKAIEQAVKEHQAIRIPLERLGVFPRPQQPRVIWVGASEQWEQDDDAKRLAALHRAVEECCGTFDFAPDGRSLSPHLTLARIKVGERHVGQTLVKSEVMDRPISLGSFAVETVVLMKSELKPTGSVYTKLWEVRLGGR